MSVPLPGGGLDAQCRCQRAQRVGLGEVAVGQERGQTLAAGAHHANAVLAQGLGVTHQVGGHSATAVGLLLLHGQAEQVVGSAFVDEALARLVDGQHARLGAVHDEVGEHGGAAIGTFAQ